MSSLSTARRHRLHRTNAAMYLASLTAHCSLDDLALIDWDALLCVPHWCFSDTAKTNRLQLVCGTVFLAPAIVYWIDGSRLLEARTLVGPDYFDNAMRAGAERAGAERAGGEPVEITDDIPALLSSAGAAVMMGAVGHDVVRSVLSEQFPMEVKAIDSGIAQAVYELALTVIDATDESAQADAVKQDAS